MERPAFRLPGFLMVGILLLVFAAACVGLGGSDTVRALLFVVAVVPLALSASGFAIVNPSEARVVQSFGRYVGSIRTAGYHWTWPFTRKTRVSLRVRNFETDHVVDLDEERKAQMVANLLVVLCGDRNVQPVVNTGTLYA